MDRIKPVRMAAATYRINPFAAIPIACKISIVLQILPQNQSVSLVLLELDVTRPAVLPPRFVQITFVAPSATQGVEMAIAVKRPSTALLLEHARAAQMERPSVVMAAVALASLASMGSVPL